jgi:hypothetical protein
MAPFDNKFLMYPEPRLDLDLKLQKGCVDQSMPLK